MKRKNAIYIIFLAVLAAVLILLDIMQNKKHVEEIAKSESESIVGLIRVGLSDALNSSEQAEYSMIERLVIGGKLIADEFDDQYSNGRLKSFADRLNMPLVIVCDAAGSKIIATSGQNEISELPAAFAYAVDTLYYNDYAWVEVGIVDSVAQFKNLYFVAYNDYRDGRIIYASVDGNSLAEYRQEYGIGKQLREVVKNPDIDFVVLTDETGSVLAGAGIDDSLDYLEENDEVFIVENSILRSDSTRLKVKLGMKRTRYDSILHHINARSIAIGGGFVVGFCILLLLMNYRKSIGKLRTETNKIRKYNDLILENIPDAIIGIDKSGTVVIANDAANKIFAQGENIIGKHYSDLIQNDPFLIFGHDEYINKNCEAELPGEKKIFICSKKYLHPDSAEEIAIIICGDITKEEYYRKELDRKEKEFAVGNLAAGIAHEIRNPLNAINVIVQRLEMEFSPVEDSAEYFSLISIVRSEIERLNRIITGFLEYSRPMPMKKSKVNLREYFSQVLAIIKHLAEPENINIKVDVRFSENDFAELDEDKIKQLLINLAKNSVEAIKEAKRQDGGEGLIEIFAEKCGNFLKIAIRDNGIGIEKSALEKIFNLYYSKKKGGSGLGLSLVRRIINEHNGAIEVQSEVGKFTQMIITFET